ncbi:unnamed protein product [Cuscuta campestris]|uniref:Cyclin-like domain-containing protein n=1 Tax=Cuscuta campestris TaxID=132261 RepID=A0A484KA30_9ASTE|nr:unnamed protein product [Cuscuta campestris]
MGNPTLSPSTLFCSESGGWSFNDYQRNGSTLIPAEEEDHDDDDGYIRMLLDRETAINGGFQKLEPSQEKWIQEARSNAIHYIIKTGAVFGFGMQTVYLSITYLDRFLSRRTIVGEKWWAMKVVGIACVSIAAKMEESNNKIPSLTEYPMEEPFIFQSSLIQRMELLVLNTLDWKLHFTTPFDFTPYFLSYFTPNPSHPKMICSTTTVDIIIFNALTDAKLMRHRASVLAAAATLLALDGLLVKEDLEVKINALPSG